jgi:hypothetical protein
MDDYKDSGHLLKREFEQKQQSVSRRNKQIKS